MTMTNLLRKIHIEDKKFVKSSEVKEYCKQMGLNYETVIRYFASRGYFVRIFRGIFYVKSIEEVKLNRIKYNHLELVAKGLNIKNVKNWYFGMHSALRLNKMTHEYFSVEDVVSDTIFRATPININGHNFKFFKLSPTLIDFGVKEKENSVKYSDPEKTILDFIYTWRYNGIPEAKIVIDISEWAMQASKSKMCKYANNYPKTVRRILERLK